MSLPKSCWTWDPRVREEDGNQQVRIEDVNSHRSIAVPRVVRRLFRDGRLFLEADDAPILVGLNHAELLGSLGAGISMVATVTSAPESPCCLSMRL